MSRGNNYSMKVLSNNRYIELSSNISLIKEWRCKVCGKPNKPDERVDTESILGDDESFCIGCWLKRIIEPSYGVYGQGEPVYPNPFKEPEPEKKVIKTGNRCIHGAYDDCKTCLRLDS